MLFRLQIWCKGTKYLRNCKVKMTNHSVFLYNFGKYIAITN